MNDHKTIAHLGFIQGVITRMGANSFLLKGWTVTLIAATFAIAVQDADKHFLLMAFFPIFTFWTLDSYYLHQEKLFRALYIDVAEGVVDSKFFTMNTKLVNSKVPEIICVSFSRTIFIFYASMIIILTIALVYFGVVSNLMKMLQV
jgi:hypothetical protein